MLFRIVLSVFNKPLLISRLCVLSYWRLETMRCRTKSRSCRRNLAPCTKTLRTDHRLPPTPNHPRCRRCSVSWGELHRPQPTMATTVVSTWYGRRAPGRSRAASRVHHRRRRAQVNHRTSTDRYWCSPRSLSSRVVKIRTQRTPRLGYSEQQPRSTEHWRHFGIMSTEVRSDDYKTFSQWRLQQPDYSWLVVGPKTFWTVWSTVFFGVKCHTVNICLTVILFIFHLEADVFKIQRQRLNRFNPLTPTVAIWVQLWSILCLQIGLSVRVPGCQKLQMTA